MLKIPQCFAFDRCKNCSNATPDLSVIVKEIMIIHMYEILLLLLIIEQTIECLLYSECVNEGVILDTACYTKSHIFNFQDHSVQYLNFTTQQQSIIKAPFCRRVSWLVFDVLCCAYCPSVRAFIKICT